MNQIQNYQAHKTGFAGSEMDDNFSKHLSKLFCLQFHPYNAQGRRRGWKVGRVQLVVNQYFAHNGVFRSDFEGGVVDEVPWIRGGG